MRPTPVDATEATEGSSVPSTVRPTSAANDDDVSEEDAEEEFFDALREQPSSFLGTSMGACMAAWNGTKSALYRWTITTHPDTQRSVEDTESEMLGRFRPQHELELEAKDAIIAKLEEEKASMLASGYRLPKKPTVLRTIGRQAAISIGISLFHDLGYKLVEKTDPAPDAKTATVGSRPWPLWTGNWIPSPAYSVASGLSTYAGAATKWVADTATWAKDTVVGTARRVMGYNSDGSVSQKSEGERSWLGAPMGAASSAFRRYWGGGVGATCASSVPPLLPGVSVDGS